MFSQNPAFIRKSRLQRAVTMNFIALLLLAGCDHKVLKEDVNIRSVHYSQVVTTDDIEHRTYSGKTQSELETDLSFRVDGTLIQRPAYVGKTMNKGELIAEMDKTDFLLSLEQAQANLAQVNAELRNAKIDLKRMSDLYAINNVSQSEFDLAQTTAKSLNALHSASSKKVDAARLQLFYSSLTSPQTCTVAQTFVENYQAISSSQKIVRLHCGESIEVVVSVPETDISRIDKGNQVLVRLSAFPEGSLTGIVKEVGVATNTDSATFQVTITIQGQLSTIRSGMAADVTFSFQNTSSPNNLIVPYVSVGEDRIGHFVFVLEAIDTTRFIAQRRRVRIGSITAKGIIITEGLNTGELIVTAGVRRLSEDQEVLLFEQPEYAMVGK